MTKTINEGIITEITDEANFIKRFKIKLSNKIKYTNGQYGIISFQDAPEIKRPFTIVSYDEDSNEIMMCIKLNGEFTKKLHSAKLGTKLFFSGPFGIFILPKEESDIVFIAGGIGITPLFSMLNLFIKSSWKKKAYLYYCTRKKQDMAFFKELEIIRNTNDPRIKINLFFSEESINGYKQGIISIKDIKKEVPEFNQCYFYICGPESMNKEMTETLIAEGIEKNKIKTEIFVSAKKI